MKQLVALYDHVPTYETSGDVTALVVTHVVKARLALDDEWRTFYTSNAFQNANSAMESADDAMFGEFGIDFQAVSSAVFNWDTAPDTSRNRCDLLAELGPGRDNVPLGAGNDVIIGYSKNAGGAGGCAEINGIRALVKWESTALGRWEVSQHEMSHLFGAPDRYGPCCDFPNHPTDVMEDQYEEPNFWCVTPGYVDWLIMDNASGKFD